MNGEAPDRRERQIPMHLIIDPPSDLACMNEEIFGPVTPVTTYRTVDDAIDRINAGPGPLAAYIVTRDDALAMRFSREVKSGGTGINTFGSQGGHQAMFDSAPDVRQGDAGARGCDVRDAAVGPATRARRRSQSRVHRAQLTQRIWKSMSASVVRSDRRSPRTHTAPLQRRRYEPDSAQPVLRTLGPSE